MVVRTVAIGEGDRLVATMEGGDSMGLLAVSRSGPSFPSPPPLRQAFTPIRGEGNDESFDADMKRLIQDERRRMSRIDNSLSRREAMVWLGTTGAIWLMTGTRSPAQAASDTPRSLCIVRPEQTEGPYFVDERLHRMDIRSDPTNGTITPGTQLALTFHISHVHAGECRPLPDAQVDIWHCDAMGVYSDVRDPGFSTVGQKFLRGYQLTDAQWNSTVPDHLPWLVPYTNGTHSFQDPHGTHGQETVRIYFPIVLSR